MLAKQLCRRLIVGLAATAAVCALLMADGLAASATSSPPPIYLTTGTALTVSVGQPAYVGIPIARLWDRTGNLDGSMYAPSIAWGDGTLGGGLVTFDATTECDDGNGLGNLVTCSAWKINATHSYTFPGLYTVTVTVGLVSDPATYATTTDYVRVIQTIYLLNEGTSTYSPGDVVYARQTPAQLWDRTGNLDAGKYSASFDWGDGTSSPGIVTFDGKATCDDGTGTGTTTTCTAWAVDATHVYSVIGTFTVAIGVDVVGEPLNYATTTNLVKVVDAPLQISGGYIFTPIGGSGDVNGELATFTDPDDTSSASDYTAIIDWGDSFTTGTITGGNGSFTVSGSHTYTDLLDWTICVGIIDVDDSTNNTNMCPNSQDLFDPGISVSGSYAFSGTEPAAVSGTVALFTDPDIKATAADYSASIDWGDGSHLGIGTIDGGNGSFSVIAGPHRYPHAGSYTITVKVTDVDQWTNSAMVTGSVSVTGDAALQAFSAPPLLETQSSASGIIAVFDDPDTTASSKEYSASIDWGDGSSSSGAVILDVPFDTCANLCTFDVSGTHAYSRPGPHIIVVTITDADNPAISATVINRTEPAVSGSGGYSLTGSAGGVTSGTVATFTDPDTGETAADYLATIDWGDGSTRTFGAPVTGSSGAFTVTGSHTFKSAGSYKITVFIRDQDADAPLLENLVTVANSANITLDTTPPSVQCTVPDQSSWYGADISVPCTASDSGSGLADARDATFSLTTNVAGGTEASNAATGSRQVCDKAGNCATAGPYTFKVDKEPPQLASCDSPDGAWHATNVTLHCTYADGGSGPTSQSVNLTTGIGPGMETSNALASGAGGQACDAVGNCASSPTDISGNKIDRKSPTITCRVASFLLNQSSASVTAVATDAGSGPASQSFSAAADTSTVGQKALTFTASDNVGNSAAASCPYSTNFAFSGFLAPLSNPPMVNTGKAGRTYAVKWQLRDANGSFISSPSAIVGVSVGSTPCGGFSGSPAAGTSGATTANVHYDAVANQYIFNWSSPKAPGCYTLLLKLESGQVFALYFSLS